MTSHQSREKLTTSGSSVNSVTPIAPYVVIRSLKKKKHVAGDPNIEI
jgi:hypothetical protein